MERRSTEAGTVLLCVLGLLFLMGQSACPESDDDDSADDDDAGDDDAGDDDAMGDDDDVDFFDFRDDHYPLNEDAMYCLPDVELSRYVVAGNTKKAIALRLTRKGARLLDRARGHRLRALATATLTGGAPTRRTVTVRRRARHHR